MQNSFMSEIYHILNRGVDKRKIFLDEEDRFRFVHDLFEFNDQKNVRTVLYNFKKFENERRNNQYLDLRSPNIKQPRELLVDIYAFCIMPNHYHLLLSPKIEDGVVKFMRKLDIGYAKYFNQKYKRKGTLFESRYKSILIKHEPHFYHLPYYIHLNPLDLKFPEWRERKLKNYREAVKFLEGYRWSSHLDYLGKKNFPSVTNRQFLLEVFEGEKEYEKSIKQWLKDLELEGIKNLILE